MASPGSNIYTKFLLFLSNRIWWLILAAIIGLVFYLRYDARVFPSASISLNLPREEIKHTARQFATELDYNKPRAIESTQFTLDGQVKTFLEYEFGTEQANLLMKDDLPVWFWRTRFCKQHEQEEFRVWLRPDGRLVAFTHEFENDKKLPSIAKSAAEKLASDFITQKARLSLNSYSLIKSASYKQPHRMDYSFTWQDNSRDFHGARLRIQVGIAGNQIDQLNYYLYVPESFQRKFSTLRSSNQLLESIASIFYSLLEIISVFIFFWAVSTKRIRWRFAIYLALIATVIDTLETFNDFASVIDSYNTQKLFSGYLFEFFIQCAVSSLTKFISYLMLIGAAELIYRISYPRKLALENLLSLKAYQTKAFLKGNLIGHLLVSINLGWIVLYYLSGKLWHFWCPSGIDTYEVLSTAVPFFSAIATGVSAAIGEEFLYRVLALSLFQRLSRSFWLANLFQAAAWGFMHSTYPQEPAYARGFELTAIGLLQGWILRRFGILPCLIGHYLFDAFVSVKPLFGAHDYWLKLGSIVPLIPFLSLLIYSFIKANKIYCVYEQALHNRALIRLYPRPAKSIIAKIKDDLKYGFVVPSATLAYMRSLSKNNILALALLIISSLLLILPLFNYEAVNRNTILLTNREHIISLAKEELRSRNIDPKQFKVVTRLSDETSFLNMQYAYEKLGLKKTLILAKGTKQTLFWKVRFFKPLDANEYIVWLDGNGIVETFVLVEPEDIAAANLSEQEARNKAEAYLKKQHSDWQPLEFENSFENQRKARKDYTFTYTVPRLAINDAEFKVSVDVLGDVVSGIEYDYDLPDQWLNERNKRTTRDEIFSQTRTIFNVVLFITAIYWAFGLLKAGHIRWQFAYFCALLLIWWSFVQNLNNYPQFYSSYLTTEPLHSYILRQTTNYIQVVQTNFLYYFCGFALAITSLYTIAPEFNLRSYIAFLLAPFNKQTCSLQKSFWLDSWLVAFSMVFFHMFINMFADFLHSAFSPGCPQESLSAITNLANMQWPSLNIFMGAISSAMNQVMLVAILAGLYKRYSKGFGMYVLFIIVFNLITHSSERYWQDYIIDITFISIWEISLWYFIVKFIGVNPLTYFLMGFIDSLLTNIIDLIQHGWPLFSAPILLAILLLLAPLIYGLNVWFLCRRSGKIIVAEAQ